MYFLVGFEINRIVFGNWDLSIKKLENSFVCSWWPWTK